MTTAAAAAAPEQGLTVVDVARALQCASKQRVCSRYCPLAGAEAAGAAQHSDDEHRAQTSFPATGQLQPHCRALQNCCSVVFVGV